MRKLCLTGVLIALLAMPVLAQFRFGGGMMGGGMDANALLARGDIQKALKLTDEQKGAIKEAGDARGKAFRAAIEDMDREAMQKIGEDYAKAMTKIKDGLKSEQIKRLGQIEVQAAVENNTASIFKREDVQKALKLTDKQKEAVKETLSDLEKDQKEAMEDAKGDKERMMELFQKKMPEMGKGAFTKITKTLTEDQVKTWKDMQGEKFEGSLRFGGFGKGKKPKKDDF